MGTLFNRNGTMPSQLLRVVMDKHGNVETMSVDRLTYATDEVHLEEAGKVVIDKYLTAEARHAYYTAMQSVPVGRIRGKPASREKWLKYWAAGGMSDMTEGIWKYLAPDVAQEIRNEVRERRAKHRASVDEQRALTREANKNRHAIEQQADILVLAQAKAAGQSGLAQENAALRAQVEEQAKQQAQLDERLRNLEKGSKSKGA